MLNRLRRRVVGAQTVRFLIEQVDCMPSSIARRQHRALQGRIRGSHTARRVYPLDPTPKLVSGNCRKGRGRD